MMHVDDFIDKRETDRYASWVLNLFRLPAALQIKFAGWIDKYELYCTYDGRRWRVTGASSAFGDIWLAKDLWRTSGYDLRVDVEKCSNWGPKP